ncbi:MAG: hypothetical protein GW748_05130 [Alphaproteobacteria bacterium]|nr:hypothetical protein [Alphaproteobacteria bacterium]NCQ67109.1 hypothetical protein [Alphaproteobacteria bacterium]NCT07706.1 hypothetical protein [Alphaproteobacteria bacterium]
MPKQKILTWLLPKLLSHEVPKYIPRTGEKGKAVNLYVITLINKKGKEEHLIDSIDLKKNKLFVRSLNEEKKEFSVENSIDVIGLKEYIFDFRHYLGLHEFNYRNIYYVFLSYIMSWDKLRVKFDVFTNRLSNYYHNKKGTFTKGRMDILKSMLELQMTLETSFYNKSNGVGKWELMSKIYTDRWILNPLRIEIRNKFELYLASLVSSGDITETDGYYVVEGKALKTLEEDEREERTHKDAKRGRNRIFWLTVIIAFSALVQAKLLSLPPISEWPTRIITFSNN